MKHIRWPDVLTRSHPDGDLKVRIDPKIVHAPRPLTRFDWGFGRQ